MENAVKTDLDPIIVRLLEFIEKKGGPSKVAHRLDIKPSVFYNYEAGRNKRPSSDMLQSIAENYPDFDPLYVLTGREVTISRTPVLTPTDGKSELLQMKITGLENENALLRSQVSVLQTIVGNQMGVDLQSKAESTDGTTQGELFGLNYMVKKGLSFTPNLDVRDAKQTTVIYPNQAPQQPPRHQ